MITSVVVGIVFLGCALIILDRYRIMCRKFTDSKSIEEFELAYNQILNIANIDAVKSEHRSNIISLVFGVLILMIGFSFVIFDLINGGQNIVINLLIIIVSSIIGLIVIVIKRDNVYKREIIRNLVLALNPNIRYLPVNPNAMLADLYKGAGFREGVSGINARDYRIDNYFYERDLRYKITDYMEYTIDNMTFVKMGDLRLKEHAYDRLEKDGNAYSSHLVFEGIIVKVSRNKSALGNVLIERNKVIKDRRRLIETDSVEFERYFDLYALNANEAISVTREVKQELVDLYKKYGIMFEISVKNREIYIRFLTGKMFENSKIFSPFNKKRLCNEYTILKNIFYITERINEMF